MNEPVVITGLGCCTALGDMPASLWGGLESGTPAALQPVPLPQDLPACAQREVPVARVPGPHPERLLGVRRPFPDRPSLMAIIAGDGALAAAGLGQEQDRRTLDPNRLGLVVNTCFGPSQTVERYLRTLLLEGPAQVSPIVFSRAVSNTLSGELARRHQLKGPSTLVVGSTTVGYALDLLQPGAADAVLCVGSDEVRDLHAWAYLRSALLDDGLVLGEGAGAVVMERESSAQTRGARPMARVLGYAAGFCPEAVHHLSSLTTEALQACMLGALADAQRPAAMVSAVVGLANGDDYLAQAERAALAFLPPSSTLLRPKLVLGETFGAAECLGVLAAAPVLRTEGALVLVNTHQVGGAVWTLVLEGISC